MLARTPDEDAHDSAIFSAYESYADGFNVIAAASHLGAMKHVDDLALPKRTTTIPPTATPLATLMVIANMAADCLPERDRDSVSDLSSNICL
jgi:hypothetical protein